MPNRRRWARHFEQAFSVKEPHARKDAVVLWALSGRPKGTVLCT
jgi:hypothetical protein